VLLYDLYKAVEQFGTIPCRSVGGLIDNMQGSQIRQRLHEGLPVVGSHVASYMNPTLATMVAEVPFDFVFICTEHIPLDRTEVGNMCRHYTARGISPIVRVPSPDKTAIAMHLDAGAEGIVVPYVETVQEVLDAVGAVHYRPVKGEILDSFLRDQHPLPGDTAEFCKKFNSEKYLIIGIESVPAIHRLEELISVPGVDGVFLGPHDITVSMGIPEQYTHPRFVDAVEAVILKCRKQGIGVGIHYRLADLGEETLRRYLDAGMNWLLNASDVTIMRDAMKKDFEILRNVTGASGVLGLLPSAKNGSEPAKSCIG